MAQPLPGRHGTPHQRNHPRAPDEVRRRRVDGTDAAPLSWAEMAAQGKRTPPFEPITAWVEPQLGLNHWWSWSPRWEGPAGRALAHLLTASEGRSVTIVAGQALPTVPGQVSVQGEDPGAWVKAQRLDGDGLLPAQAWILDNMLHLSPQSPARSRRHAVCRQTNGRSTLARQFHARERSLQVPRKHVEELTEPDGTVIEVQLGQFVDNTPRRADKLNQDRPAELDALGMRW